MINFLYKFGLISIFSFTFSNVLFYFFEKILHASFASFVTILIIFNLNTLLFFKLKLFGKTKKNYYKLLLISVCFRILEFTLFNILYFFILTNIKSNYIFVLTLIISYLIKTFVYYQSSIKDRNNKI